MMTEEPHIQERMYNAIQAGDVTGFARMLQENPEHARHPDGRSLWFSDAASAGQLAIVQLLVRLGVDVNEPANNDSVPSPEGVIYRAASRGHPDVVRWLLDQGAAVNHEIGGRTRCFALVGAARGGHLDVVKLLVQRGAAVNAVWAEMSPLDHALAAGQGEVAEYLRLVGAKTAGELGPQQPPRRPTGGPKGGPGKGRTRRRT